MGMHMHIASASGNVFGYFWGDELPTTFDGPAWARVLSPRGVGFGLDGLFRLQRPRPGQAWEQDHWDADGAYTFCSNGSRAAMQLEGSPQDAKVVAMSSGIGCLLRRDQAAIGIRMPEGPDCGLRTVPIKTPQPSGFGFVGNPQLVLRVPAVAEVDLARLAPALRWNSAFPEGTNVNVVEVASPGQARIRSYERGVEGETLCCGTGCAVAAAWLARTEGVSDWTFQTQSGEPVTVALRLDSKGRWSDLWLSGPVRRLGRVELDPSLGLG